MAAAGALVEVTAERRVRHLSMAASTFRCSQVNHFRRHPEIGGSCCAYQVGHLQGWPRHLLRGERERVEGAGRSSQMAFRQVDVTDIVFRANRSGRIGAESCADRRQLRADGWRSSA